jgi:hypothetical protein
MTCQGGIQGNLYGMTPADEHKVNVKAGEKAIPQVEVVMFNSCMLLRKGLNTAPCEGCWG